MIKAAELDPRSAIIGVALAGQYATQGLYSRAEQQFKKVIELNPDFARGYMGWAGHYAGNQGRIDLAIQKLRTAVKIDPESGQLASAGQKGAIFEYFRQEKVPRRSARDDGRANGNRDANDQIYDIF